jgi:hypothetical protein
MVFNNVLLIKGYKVDILGLAKLLWYMKYNGVFDGHPNIESLSFQNDLGIIIGKDGVRLAKNYEKIEKYKDNLFEVMFECNKMKYLKDLKIKIFWPVCCSTSKDYIIGRVVREYEREDKRCKDCDKYTLCDRCIGYVKGGWFDIDDIFEHMTKIDDDRVCNHCYKIHDQKFTRCKECKALKKIRVYDDIDNPLEYPEFEKHQSYYLTLDDCTSCS